MPNRAAVRSGGYAYRFEGRLLEEEFSRAGELQHLLLRNTQALLPDVADGGVQPASFAGAANAAGCC